MIVFVHLYIPPSHYHHCANLSEDIEPIKCLSDIFCRVCKIKHILLVLHYTICGVVCFQFTHFPCDDWENIYLCLIIIIKSEVWTITNYLGLGHEAMVCAVCLHVFLCIILWVLMHMYERRTRLILVYGSDVWGSQSQGTLAVDKILFWYMRFILQVKLTTSNIRFSRGKWSDSAKCLLSYKCHMLFT